MLDVQTPASPCLLVPLAVAIFALTQRQRKSGKVNYPSNDAPCQRPVLIALCRFPTQKKCLDFFEPLVYYVYITVRWTMQMAMIGTDAMIRMQAISLLGGTEAVFPSLLNPPVDRLGQAGIPTNSNTAGRSGRERQEDFFRNKANRSL